MWSVTYPSGTILPTGLSSTCFTWMYKATGHLPCLPLQSKLWSLRPQRMVFSSYSVACSCPPPGMADISEEHPLLSQQASLSQPPQSTCFFPILQFFTLDIPSSGHHLTFLVFPWHPEPLARHLLQWNFLEIFKPIFSSRLHALRRQRTFCLPHQTSRRYHDAFYIENIKLIKVKKVKWFFFLFSLSKTFKLITLFLKIKCWVMCFTFEHVGSNTPGGEAAIFKGQFKSIVGCPFIIL